MNADKPELKLQDNPRRASYPPAAERVHACMLPDLEAETPGPSDHRRGWRPADWEPPARREHSMGSSTGSTQGSPSCPEERPPGPQCFSVRVLDEPGIPPGEVSSPRPPPIRAGALPGACWGPLHSFLGRTGWCWSPDWETQAVPQEGGRA